MAIDLFIQDSRVLDHTDPAHRLAVLGCGTALHHALISLASDGRHATVTRLPDPADPRHLATVRVGADVPVEAGAIREYGRHLLTGIGYPYLVLRFGAVGPGTT